MEGTRGPFATGRGKSNSTKYSLHAGGDDEAVVVYAGDGSAAQDLASAEDLPESAAALAAALAAAGGASGVSPSASAESSSLGAHSSGSRLATGSAYTTHSSTYTAGAGGASPGTGSGSPGAGDTPGGSPGASSKGGGDPGASLGASSRRSLMARSRSGRQQSHAERPPVFRSWKEREGRATADSGPGSPGCTTSVASNSSTANYSSVAGTSGLGGPYGKGRKQGGPRLCSTLGSPGELSSSGLAAADLSRWAAEGAMWGGTGAGAGVGAGVGAGRHSGGLGWAESEKEARGSPWSAGGAADHSSEGSPPVGGIPPAGRGAHPGGTSGAPPKGTSLLTKLSSMKGLKGSLVALSDPKKRSQGAARRTLSDGGDGILGDVPTGPAGPEGGVAPGVPSGMPGVHQGSRGKGGSPTHSKGGTLGAKLSRRSRSITSNEAAADAAAAARAPPPPSGLSLLRDRSFNGRHTGGSGSAQAPAAEAARREGGAQGRTSILRSASQDHSGMGAQGKEQGGDGADSPWAMQRRVKDRNSDAASSSDSPWAHQLRTARDPASPGQAPGIPPCPPGSGRPPGIPLPCSAPPPPSVQLRPPDAPSQARGETPSDPPVRPRAASVGPGERAQDREGGGQGSNACGSLAPGLVPATGTLSARQQLSTEDRIRLWEVEKVMGRGREAEGGHDRDKARAHRGSSAHRERRREAGHTHTQGQERGSGSATGATTALGSSASAPLGAADDSDISSEEGDALPELPSAAKNAQRAQRRQQQQLQLSEGELADMVARLDAKLERLRRKRAGYVERLHRAMQRKERVAGPIQQCLKPAASPSV